ncbi:MAG: pyruvate:ferredoxin (flavodoxin) oxidoreductase [Candidatus Methylacidiphilales bacterium]
MIAPLFPQNHSLSEVKTIDGNEAAASIAYRLSETIAIYPITPSTPMGELSDEWAANKKTNLWGNIPDIVQMQSEAGVAGALHGMLQAGSLSTSFTASQGLLLMMPDMFKIAGELTPFVLHVAARTVATHALSIFGDHSDIMAVRATGFALLGGSNPQEAHDLALISHASTLASRIPFMHFLDGFRTSHELNQVSMLSNDHIRELIDPQWIQNHYSRALTPDAPKIRGTAHNPDTYFQAREACNTSYLSVPEIVQAQMDRLAALCGRSYHLFNYQGDPEAETVLVIMGSGAETAIETVKALNSNGRRLGVLQVLLYRPFSIEHFVRALPDSVQRLVVLDRTKEPGAPSEPLHQDVVTALYQTGRALRSDGSLLPVLAGRYGISSKEFTPSMVKAVFDHAESSSPKPVFTVGIVDDITHLSLPIDHDYEIDSIDITQALFYGLGSDGTVGANKNTIKILGNEGLYAQGYFVYDSKKSGAITISHLRFGQQTIRAPYLIRSADFIGCHQWSLMERYDVLEAAREGSVFLLNSPYSSDETWSHLPREIQQTLIEKKLRFYVIDAYRVAKESGMGGRINTIMQTCFFALSDSLPKEKALDSIKQAIQKTYAIKGENVVAQNIAAVDQALAHLHPVTVPSTATASFRPATVSTDAPDFVQRVTAVMMRGQGDLLPVSAFPVDGTWPSGTARWEKRTLTHEAPAWDADLCIQCNKCVMVCPHACIRAKYYPESALEGAPEHFASAAYRSKENPGHRYTIQLAPDDCTGCSLCVMVCPAKDKTNPKHKALDITPLPPVIAKERENFDFFLNLPEVDRTRLDITRVKDVQFAQPLFEFSGACAGCGETPYIKLLTQLCGDRALIANATGCSSIYGGNLPTTPYTCDSNGRGPAWSNSLFEDNAEYGFGMRVALDHKVTHARALLMQYRTLLGTDLVDALLEGEQSTETGIAAQRSRVAELLNKLDQLDGLDRESSQRLRAHANYLVRKSVWIVGGDGWAYDIGFGGLDHVMAQGRDINILVLDTEVYSNTGGQQSKSTPTGAVAKFATNGKSQAKKDLGLLAMGYGNVYVARVAFGANDSQTARAFAEAEAYPGTSLIIAYSHCIAHGYSLTYGLEQQKNAVNSGYWPLYRFDPRKDTAQTRPLHLDSATPKMPVHQFTENETRFRILQRAFPERAKELNTSLQQQINHQRALYELMARGINPVNPTHSSS